MIIAHKILNLRATPINIQSGYLYIVTLICNYNCDLLEDTNKKFNRDLWSLSFNLFLIFTNKLSFSKVDT